MHSLATHQRLGTIKHYTCKSQSDTPEIPMKYVIIIPILKMGGREELKFRDVKGHTVVGEVDLEMGPPEFETCAESFSA